MTSLLLTTLITWMFFQSCVSFHLCLLLEDSSGSSNNTLTRGVLYCISYKIKDKNITLRKLLNSRLFIQFHRYILSYRPYRVPHWLHKLYVIHHYFSLSQCNNCNNFPIFLPHLSRTSLTSSWFYHSYFCFLDPSPTVEKSSVAIFSSTTALRPGCPSNLTFLGNLWSWSTFNRNWTFWVSTRPSCWERAMFVALSIPFIIIKATKRDNVPSPLGPDKLFLVRPC